MERRGRGSGSGSVTDRDWAGGGYDIGFDGKTKEVPSLGRLRGGLHILSIVVSPRLRVAPPSPLTFLRSSLPSSIHSFLPSLLSIPLELFPHRTHLYLFHSALIVTLDLDDDELHHVTDVDLTLRRPRERVRHEPEHPLER